MLIRFTASCGGVSDTFDIGMDANAPVSLDYYDRAPFMFNGKIEKVYIKYID